MNLQSRKRLTDLENELMVALVVVAQSLSHVQLFATPWTAAHQASLSFTISQSLIKLISIELVKPFNHLILCCPLLCEIDAFPFHLQQGREGKSPFSTGTAHPMEWMTFFSLGFPLHCWKWECLLVWAIWTFAFSVIPLGLWGAHSTGAGVYLECEVLSGFLFVCLFSALSISLDSRIR